MDIEEQEIPTIEQAESALNDFEVVMNELGLPFMADGGTLLGFYRDNAFCEGDHDDIDLTTLVGEEYIQPIVELACEKGFTVYKIWRQTEKTSAQIAVKRDGVKIDLMFKRIKGDNVWWTVYRGETPTYKSVPARLIEAIIGADDSTYNKEAREEYLTIRYGDWRTKVSRKDYSCYKHDLSIKKSFDEV